MAPSVKRIAALLDGSGSTLIGLNNSGWIDHRVLAAGVAEVHTIPTGAKSVVFSADEDFYACIGGAAAIPSADVTNGSGSMFNPTLRGLGDATTIGLISPTACIVTMEFYS